MQKNWIYKVQPDPKSVDQLARALGIQPELATLLIQRGVDDYDKAYAFFRPKIEELHDPFLMKDMNRAVDRILSAIQQNENILVYGDYDVDGTTSVALLYSFLRDELRYNSISFYIPDRYSEGYGISFKGIDFAADNDFSLVISLDCGIKAIEQMRYANEKNIDFIICDHHLPGEENPSAFAVLNPKQQDCNYPFKELCGCGVGFKLVQALGNRLNIPSHHIYPFLDLVAVGTCSDIVPLTGENRILVHFGLQQLNDSPRPGLRQLKHVTGVIRDFSVEDVVFMIGPRINAAGRIKHGSGAVELLIAHEDDELLGEMSGLLETHNKERRELDRSITDEAIRLVESNDIFTQRTSTVVYHPDWHKGVIGIVASRLVERFHKPTIVLTLSNGKVSGSARSIRGFDVHHAIEQCADLLENFGGHMHAAGLTLSEQNVEPFIQRFEEIVSGFLIRDLLVPQIEIDLPISLHEITPKFFRILKQFAPFGPGNMNPVFSTNNLKGDQWTKTVGEKHLKLNVSDSTDPSIRFSAIGFNLGHFAEKIAGGTPFSAAYVLSENTWNGVTSLQVEIKDLVLDEKAQ